MTQERDERWAYVALAVLVIAYIVYRYAGSSGLSNVSLQLPGVRLGTLARSATYLAAPLFAVLSEVLRRRKARAVREEWERRARAEGFVREEENARVAFVAGARGSIQADIRLTRAALYLFDRGGRREPMRLVFAPEQVIDMVIADVQLLGGTTPERGRVRLFVTGAADFQMEFESVLAEAWWSSLRRAMGKSANPAEARRGVGEGVDDDDMGEV